ILGGYLSLSPLIKIIVCSISISNLDPEPIVVSDQNYQFLYAEPDASALSINAGDTVIISCPGGQLSMAGDKKGTTIPATCVSDTQFTVDGQQFNFNQIACSRNPFHTARYTGNSCGVGGKEIEIGFILNDDSFAREIIVCFDEQNLNSLYSTYDLTRSIGHHESGVDRPSFIEDDFYNLGIRVNDLYVRDGQKATINGLLGLPADSTKYIKDSSDYFLARGHLTAKADFVYAPQQTATFHYVNAAPQWQTFNGDNWSTAEADVRDYAELNQLDLKVYTGTYGVTTLPHVETGEEIPIYLYVDDDGKTGIPVPELYWKVVYNPAAKEGVALLGINNPYQNDVAKSVICNDISSSLNWLHWNPTDLKAGYSYACTIDDLRQRVPYLPDFEVNGILL
ncbi:Endonuclease NS domain containing protein, partial [Asbolus verrucosus]